MGEYNYQPLDLDRPAIRLLTLHGGSDDDEIFCSLFQAELRERDETIPYDALSYTWGSPDLTERIIVDGCYLNVTSHLFVALRHLRYQDKDRILWIDAICINQGSKKERGHQVEQMSKIYKEADRVIFWLGPGTLETNVLIESLQLLQRECIQHNIIDYSLQDPLWKYMWSSVELSLKRSYTNFSDLQRRGLQEIFKRPWFRRVWILQEVALARVGFIQCGTRSVSTRFFGLLPVLLNIKPDAHCQSVLDIMPSPWRKTSWWSKSPNLRTLLLNFGDSEATESRDLVYALRGISSDAAKKNVIIPDYDNSEEDLVREVVQFVEHCELEDLALPTTPCTIRDLVKCLRALNLNRCMALAEQSLPHDMEMLLERPEVRINEDVVGAAAECDKTGEVIEILLRHRGKDFTVSDDVLIAAAKNQSGAKGVFEALLRYQGGRIAISDTVLMAAAENKQCSDEVLNLFWTSIWDRSRVIDGRVLIAAAQNKTCGNKAINALFSNDFLRVYDLDEVAIAAAENDGCGDEVINILLSYHPNSNFSEEVIIAAAKNEGCGDKVLSILISSKRDPLKGITKKVLEAAAKNKGCGDKVINMLLSYDPKLVKHSKSIIMDAIENERCGDKVINTLLSHGPDFVNCSERIIITAAKNEGCGDKVLNLLLFSKRNQPKGITEKALEAAAKNEGCGDKAMNILLSCTKLHVAYSLEDVFIAAANNKRCGDKVINTLLSHYPDQVNFSKEAAIAAAKKKGCSDVIINVLLSHCSDLTISRRRPL